MFRGCITTTPLYNDGANSYFSNIRGESFAGDISFISTLRALVAPRMGENEDLYVRFGNSNYSAKTIGGVPISRAIKAICGRFYAEEPEQIYIHNLQNSNQADNYANIELLKTSFPEVYNGWHLLEKVTDFFRKQFYVICFINPEIRSVALFVDNITLTRLHYLQCSIFAILPWYFNPEEGVSGLEMELIKSLKEKTPDQYLDCIAKIAEPYDFRSEKIKKLLGGFELRYERLARDDVRRDIDIIISDINSLNDRIGSLLNNKKALDLKLLGIENKLANNDNDSEIMEYFLCNNKVHLDGVTDTTLRFVVSDYITYFDEDAAQSAINNSNGFVYRPDGIDGDDYIPKESIKKLMTEIFLRQTLKIKCCSAYEFTLGERVNPLTEYPFDSEFRDCMPNPHTNIYRCMGDYVKIINDLLINHNYIGAIEQSIASCKSLNFYDHTVMTAFMRTIYGQSSTNNRCIELPTGEIVTPKEAIKWIESREEDEDNE